MPIELDFLVPGGALSGPLMAGLIKDLEDDRPQLGAGSRLGPFEIIRELARGGSSTVYLGKRVGSDFQQQVAIKVVRTNDVLRQLFRAERRILAAFEHPNIARLIDGGESGDGFLWLAMEHVDGVCIHRYCQENRLGWRDRVRLVIDVLSAIKYAHCHLIVHGDIKPENIMVDGSGIVRLLDFGVSSLKEEPDVKHRAFTPRWASPEQLNGQSLTTSSDVYQLGLLLKDLLLDGVAPRMSSLRKRELKAIVAIATQADPEARYPSAAAMQRDLIQLRDGMPISVIDAGWYSAARFCRRHMASVTIGAVGASALLAAVLMGMVQLRHERSASLDAAKRAESAANEAQSLSEFMVGVFGYGDPGVNQGSMLTAIDVLDRSAKQLEESAGMDAERAAAMAAEIGRIYYELNEYDKAIRVLDDGIGRVRYRVSDSSIAYVRLLEQRGLVAMTLDDTEVATRYFDSALDRARRVPWAADRALEVGRIHSYQALTLRAMGRYQDAWVLARRAVEQLVAARGQDHIDTGKAQASLGLVAFDVGEYAAADEAIAHAIRVFQMSYGKHHPRTLNSTAHLAMVRMVQGQLASADSHIREVITIERKVYRGRSRRLAFHLGLMAHIEFEKTRYRSAISFVQEADVMLVELGFQRHQRRAETLLISGNARLAVGDLAGAVADFDQARQIVAAAGRSDGATEFEALIGLAQARALSGEAERADGLFRDALALLNPSPPATALARLKFSKFLHEAGRHEEADAMLALARNSLRGVVGAPSGRRLLAEVERLHRSH